MVGTAHHITCMPTQHQQHCSKASRYLPPPRGDSVMVHGFVMTETECYFSLQYEHRGTAAALTPTH